MKTQKRIIQMTIRFNVLRKGKNIREEPDHFEHWESAYQDGTGQDYLLNFGLGAGRDRSENPLLFVLSHIPAH